MISNRGFHRLGRLGCFAALGFMLAWCEPARAENLQMADGRVLEGLIVQLPGVAVNPLANGGAAADEVKSIAMCDNELTRTFVSRRLVVKVNAAAPAPFERFVIEQPVAQNGLPIAALGTITRTGPWDKFGRRIFGMVINGAPIDVIQGLTEITPTWSKVESLRKGGTNYIWDMRIATSTIPRDLLSAILSRQIDPKDPDQRLKLVRFYMQAERFQDAETELAGVIKDFKNFPNLPALGDQDKALRQLAAQRLLSEVEMRRQAGQHRLAYRMLENFPIANVNGVVLQKVRDKLEEYTKLQKRRADVLTQLDGQIGKVKDPAVKKLIQPIRDEIGNEMFIATFDRLAPFARLADDPDMLPEQKLALAISGWLFGPNDAIDNLETALSLVETRTVIRKYLAEPLPINREPLLSSLGSQQGASPKYVAELLAHMKPPIETPAQATPGFFKLEIHGIANEPDVAYWVQLPPEYDPYIKYPTVVTLNAAGTTPEQQIDWWAGISRETAARAAAAESHRQKSRPVKRTPIKRTLHRTTRQRTTFSMTLPLAAPAARRPRRRRRKSRPAARDRRRHRQRDAAGASHAAGLYRHRPGLDQAPSNAIRILGPRACGRAGRRCATLAAGFPSTPTGCSSPVTRWGATRPGTSPWPIPICGPARFRSSPPRANTSSAIGKTEPRCRCISSAANSTATRP